MTAVAAAYGLLLVGTLMQMRRQPVPVGAGLVGIDKVVGLVGEVQADLAPSARSTSAANRGRPGRRDGSPLARGTKVRVVGQEGLILIVERWISDRVPPGSGVKRCR